MKRKSKKQYKHLCRWLHVIQPTFIVAVSEGIPTRLGHVGCWGAHIWGGRGWGGLAVEGLRVIHHLHSTYCTHTRTHTATHPCINLSDKKSSILIFDSRMEKKKKKGAQVTYLWWNIADLSAVADQVKGRIVTGQINNSLHSLLPRCFYRLYISS